MEWYVGVLKKYAVFEGRARRKEFWMFCLFNMIIGIVFSILGNIGFFFNVIYGIYGLAILVPSIAVGVRRLHDTNRSGLFLLLALIPLVGAIILIVFLAQDSAAGDNKYGANPKGVKA